MNEQLQQARQAIQNGNRAQAQIVLAKLLKSEPGNSEAWFLLSEMAISDEQRLTFLRRVVTLNPNHAQAQQKLAELEPPMPAAMVIESRSEPTPAGNAILIKPEPEIKAVEPAQNVEVAPAGLPISTTPLDFEAQSIGNTVPPWLANDVQYLGPTGTASEILLGAPEPPKPPANIPEWLKSQPNEDWLVQEQPDKGKVVWKAGDSDQELKPAKPIAPRPKPTNPKQPTKSNDSLLILLIVFALIIFIAFIFALFTYF